MLAKVRNQIVSFAALTAVLLPVAARGETPSTTETSTKKSTEETEKEKVQTKQFCSKVSEADAEKRCNDWLTAQKTTLGTRLLTAECSAGELGDVNGCFYRSIGELRYVIKVTTSTTTTEK